ncbi:hypothetical protein HYV88_06155 [Candidatus Woesearchaeota archaeon]|nr:hypothetical protein [Candidatus Woesearchaeota archaeon]
MSTRYHFKNREGQALVVSVDYNHYDSKWFLLGGLSKDQKARSTSEGLVIKVSDDPNIGDRLLFIPEDDEEKVKRLNKTAVLIPRDYIDQFNSQRRLTGQVYKIDRA